MLNDLVQRFFKPQDELSAMIELGKQFLAQKVQPVVNKRNEVLESARQWSANQPNTIKSAFPITQIPSMYISSPEQKGALNIAMQKMTSPPNLKE